MRWAVLAFVAVFGLAVPASAHVSVSSPGAAAGDYAVLTFRVPTESAGASTTKLALSLPSFQSVAVQRTPGWTYELRRSGSTVTEIDWSAATADAAIKPGEFGQFAVSVGPLPDTPSVVFGAVQTYSDGTVVRWNQSAAPGSSAEPDHPKPTLRLAVAEPAAAGKADTTAPTILSVVAVVLAAAALGVAVVGNARRKAAQGVATR